jgi:prepilin peptidase CpaA
LFAVIGGAAFFDIKERRIPNWIILFALTVGLLLGAFQSSTQFIFSVTGFGAGILALTIPFALGWMGAGDVKFFAAVGALLGYKTLPRIFFYSCIVAGVLALIAMALGQIRQISFKHLLNSTAVNSGRYSVPWGVAIGAGTIMAYYLDPSGTWAGF